MSVLGTTAGLEHQTIHHPLLTATPGQSVVP